MVRQEAAALGEHGATTAIGEQAEGADRTKRVGTMWSRKRRRNSSTPMVGEGHAVGVTPEIGKHVLGSSKRRFAVDDPRRVAELVSHAVKAVGAASAASPSVQRSAPRSKARCKPAR